MGLPSSLLRKRIENEVEVCGALEGRGVFIIAVSDRGFPVVLRICIKNVVAMAGVGSKPRWKSEHEFEIVLTSDYPYQKPVVRWLTDIVHPNIMHPSEGGTVCTKMLDRWGFGSNIAGFIAGIETLLANPNPKCPLDTPYCTKAAEYLNKAGVSKQKYFNKVMHPSYYEESRRDTGQYKSGTG